MMATDEPYIGLTKNLSENRIISALIGKKKVLSLFL